mmetsp:Transcript_53265/g.137502  ORF Transcript_53265/g.137502 Transcript_53265/m.137502 type:complete len:272 (+) Transcript_53265:48-863(+)
MATRCWRSSATGPRRSCLMCAGPATCRPWASTVTAVARRWTRAALWRPSPSAASCAWRRSSAGRSSSAIACGSSGCPASMVPGVARCRRPALARHAASWPQATSSAVSTWKTSSGPWWRRWSSRRRRVGLPSGRPRARRWSSTWWTTSLLQATLSLASPSSCSARRRHRAQTWTRRTCRPLRAPSTRRAATCSTRGCGATWAMSPCIRPTVRGCGRRSWRSSASSDGRRSPRCRPPCSPASSAWRWRPSRVSRRPRSLCWWTTARCAPSPR